VVRPIDYGALPEASKRYLRRIATLMLERASCDIDVKLQDGGVRDYRESRGLRPADLDESDESLVGTLGT
jgi:hypothetical protein